MSDFELQRMSFLHAAWVQLSDDDTMTLDEIESAILSEVGRRIPLAPFAPLLRHLLGFIDYGPSLKPRAVS